MWEFLLGVISGWASQFALLLFISRRMQRRGAVRKVRMAEQVIVRAENRDDS